MRGGRFWDFVGRLLIKERLTLDSHQPLDLRSFGVLGEDFIGLLQRRIARPGGSLHDSFLDERTCVEDDPHTSS